MVLLGRRAVLTGGALDDTGFGPSHFLVQTLEILGPQSVRTLGSASYSNWTGDLAVSPDERHAYVATIAASGDEVWENGPGRLTVVDIQRPREPVVVGELELPRDGNGIAATNSHVYVACDEAGLQVVDVSGPAIPAVAETVYRNGLSIGDIALVDGLLVAAWEDGAQLLDITDPAAPRALSFVPLPQGAGELAVDGNLVWTATEEGGVVLLEVLR
jgi:hypothetical protein